MKNSTHDLFEAFPGELSGTLTATGALFHVNDCSVQLLSLTAYKVPALPLGSLTNILNLTDLTSPTTLSTLNFR